MSVSAERRKGPSLCGQSYHPINSCLECKRHDMRARRLNKGKRRQAWGFKGPECFECGGIASKVKESGFTDDGLRIRRRECVDCGQSCASVEVYIDPEQTSFWKLNGKRMRRARDRDYIANGKGAFRTPSHWREPDQLDVTVKVIPSKSEKAA